MVVMTNIDLEQDVAVEQLIPDGQFADLLAFIGHELRTPLTSVAACAELLETADDPVEREVFAATMRRQIGRLMLVFDAALRAAGTLDGGGDLSTDVKGALEHAARRLTEFDSRIEVRVACVPMARACMDTAAL